MTSRYAPIIAVLGGVLAVVASVDVWPEAIPTSADVALPTIAIGVFAILLAVGWFTGRVPNRMAGAFSVILGLGLMVIGGYGYFHFMLEEIGSILGSVAAIVGGGLSVIAGVSGWFGIDDARFRRQAKSAILMTVVGFGGLIAVIIWSFILATVWLLISGGTLDDMELIAISTISLGLGMGSVAGLYLLGANRSWSFIDLRRPTLRDVAWTVGGIVGLFAALIALGILLELVQAPSPEHDIVETVREGDPNILLYVLIPASILVIGPGEELLFRNIVQKSLYEYFSRAGAIVVASVVFAIAHIPAYGMAQAGTAVIVVFILSLLLGAIYARTENIIVPSLVHGFYNAILFATLYLELTMDELPSILLPLCV